MKTYVEELHDANKQISDLANENRTLKKQLKKEREKQQSAIDNYMRKYAEELLYPEIGLVSIILLKNKKTRFVTD